MARISLKDLATLRQNLKLISESKETYLAKYKDSQKTGDRKPTQYGADEEYTNLFKLGPVVDDLVTGIAALEDEIQHIHQYVAGQLGLEADRSVLPGNVEIDANGTPKKLIYVDAAGQTVINVDELFVGPNSLYVNGKKVIHDAGDTITLSTDANKPFVVQTTGTGITQINSEKQVNITPGTDGLIVGGKITASGGIVVDSRTSIIGNDTAGLTLGKTTIDGTLSMGNDIILDRQYKIAFAGDQINTYIAANTNAPEDLEIHADGNVNLRPDNNVQVNGVNVIDENGNWIGSVAGMQGAQGETGLKGDKGDQGDRGFQGFQGIKGTKGDKGDKGDSVTKVAQQEGNLIVTVEGQGEINVGRVYGDQGARGFQGDKGDKGDRGFQGDKGDKGDRGFQGFQGDKGDKGDRGFQGDKGDKGDRGFQGYQGDQGDKGDRGFQGYQGDQGIDGKPGPQGDQGDKGDRGFQGYQGDQGDRGFQGYQGDQGDKGDRGFQGYQGDQGDRGFQGYQGDQGDQGDKGDRGFQGHQGDQGHQGSTLAVSNNANNRVITATGGNDVNGEANLTFDGTTLRTTALRIDGFIIDQNANGDLEFKTV